MPDPLFSDDAIRQRAYEIYQARGGNPGDPNADWQEAIRQLEQEHTAQKRRRSIFFWLNRPFVWFEKETIEPTANWLDKADIFRIIEKVSPVIEAIGVIAGAIIIPVVIWQVGERAQDAQEKQEKAVRAQTAVQNYLNQLSDTLTTGKLRTDKDLQIIIRASTLALLDSPDLQPQPDLDEFENLQNDRKGQTIGYLSETGLIQVEEPKQPQNNKQAGKPKEPVISLAEANLSGAGLIEVNLRGANFNGANLSGAFLSGANLSNTDLSGADLSDAILNSINLSGADLTATDLSGANLTRANLSGANLRGAFLTSANLSSANLSGANLSSAILIGTNLSSAQNWSEEKLTRARLCKTKLPAGANLDPNRDCKELGGLPQA